MSASNTAKVLDFPMRAERASVKDSAKVLRATLRAAFPATKFTVRMDRGTAYGSVSVGWTDGPTMSVVKPILDSFKGKSFDGMDDSTHYLEKMMPDGRISGLGYVSGQRDISLELARRCAAQLAAHFEVPAPEFGVNNWGSWIVKGDNDQYAALNESWSTMIYRASLDRTRYAVGV